jgi:hypothetical protein
MRGYWRFYSKLCTDSCTPSDPAVTEEEKHLDVFTMNIDDVSMGGDIAKGGTSSLTYGEGGYASERPFVEMSLFQREAILGGAGESNCNSVKKVWLVIFRYETLKIYNAGNAMKEMQNFSTQATDCAFAMLAYNPPLSISSL